MKRTTKKLGTQKKEKKKKGKKNENKRKGTKKSEVSKIALKTRISSKEKPTRREKKEDKEKKKNKLEEVKENKQAKVSKIKKNIKAESGKNFCVNFLLKIRDVLVTPTKFFKKLDEKNISIALSYFLILTTLYLSLTIINDIEDNRNIVSMILKEFNLTLPQYWLKQGFFITALLLSLILSIIGLFILSALLHLWILIFGGKGGFKRTLQLYIYSKTPVWLFAWIPFSWIWLFTEIYSLILLIIGTQELHSISKKKAIWMYVGPLLVVIGVGVVSFILILNLMGKLL